MMKSFALLAWICVVLFCAVFSLAWHRHYSVYIGYLIPLVGLPWNFLRLRSCDAKPLKLLAWVLPPPVFFFIAVAIDFKLTTLT